MVYEAKTIKAPILRGGALKAYASAVRTPVLGGLLGSQMLGLAGVPQLREFVADDKLCSLRKRFFRPNQWGPYERTVCERSNRGRISRLPLMIFNFGRLRIMPTLMLPAKSHRWMWPMLF